jgi:site-specific recombinase XerD
MVVMPHTNDAPRLLDLRALLASFELALRAERMSPNTIASYADAVKAYLRWCEKTGMPAQLSKTAVQTFIADLLDGGAQAATAQARHKGLRRFSRWLASEGELADDVLASLRSPKVDRKVVQALDTDQLKRLFKACAGRELADRRDEAIIRLMAETGMRASEVTSLLVTDVDVARGQVLIQRGKGGKGREVSFGAQTGIAIDRYLRQRRSAGLGDGGQLWVGRGGSFGYSGLDAMLKARAAAAGIDGFHAHLLRHTWATRWKAAQGSDDGLMAVAGWSSRSMIDRYAGAAAAQRAGDESRRLGLGDL